MDIFRTLLILSKINYEIPTQKKTNIIYKFNKSRLSKLHRLIPPTLRAALTISPDVRGNETKWIGLRIILYIKQKNLR